MEGIDEKALEEILLRFSTPMESSEKITKTDLYDAGLYGGADCAAARMRLCKELSIPEKISVNGLIDALNTLITKEEFFKIIGG